MPQRDVPGWARHAIWYQIFPERFRNGDRRNDPTSEDLLYAWPQQRPTNWKVSPWTSDWYKLQPWETAGDKGFYFRVQQRRYGGDLQGVLDKLDYLQKLGITALYFTPLFESPSTHKYDAAMYHHIDNNFGPDPEGDRRIWDQEDPANADTWRWTSADKLFLKLVREVHRRGMKLILDGVFNHTGSTFWAFLDVRKNGEKSRYKDWYTVDTYDDPATPENEFACKYWSGVKELPEIRRDSTGLASGPREHIRDIVTRWMDPNRDGNPDDGIDGWRLDVAEKVPIPFWRDFRTWVRRINPQAYIVGEVWWEDYARDKMFNAAPWLQGDVFDAVMNYRWAREACHFFIDKQNAISPSEFDARLAGLRSEYPTDNNYVLMNLLDSHDTDRIGSHIVNPDTRYDGNVGVKDNREYEVRKPNAKELRIQKLMVLFQMTYLGAPMIYYGDEAGMWGGDDPDARKPMLWPEYQYHDEKSHPFNQQRPRDVNRFDRELFEWYSKLARTRNDNPALRTGTYEPIVTLDDKNVLAYRRVGKEGTIVVALNNAWSAQTVSIPFSTHAQRPSVVDLLSGKSYALAKDSVTVTLSAKSGMILQ